MVKSYKIVPLVLMISIIFNVNAGWGQQRDTIKRMLISSGGGARGAWGVGLATALMNRQKACYDVAFGTSTGSLMSPLLLLGDTAIIKRVYTTMSQDSIFRVNPFHVDSTGGVVHTGAAWWLNDSRLAAVPWILRFGKPSLGESQPLLKLIREHFGEAQYDSLFILHRHLAVAVSNMKTGKVEIKYSDTVNAETGCMNNAVNKDSARWEQMCRWIWASADEPLWMSYYIETCGADTLGDYVDGGLVDVVPILQGIEYAIDNDINDVDVIVNNSRHALNGNWHVDSAGWFSGLERILDVYDEGIRDKDTLIGSLFTNNYDLQDSIVLLKEQLSEYRQMLNERDSSGSHKELKVKSISDLPAQPRFIKMTFYFMPDSLAAMYPNELGFYSNLMTNLYNAGRQSLSNLKYKSYQYKFNNESYRRFMHNNERKKKESQ